MTTLSERQQLYADKANREAELERDYRKSFERDARAFVLANAKLLTTPEGIEQFRQAFIAELVGEFVKDTTTELDKVAENVD